MIMCLSIALSASAVLIALLSFALSGYLAFRDRSHLTVEARYLCSYENMSDAIYLHIVNDGRRPITVKRLVIKLLNGETVQYKLKSNDKDVRLMESQDFEMSLDSINSDINEWARMRASKAYVVDSKDRKYNTDGFVDSLSEYARNL